VEDHAVKKCHVCCGLFDDEKVTPEGACLRCDREMKFADFAESCGLYRYPHPGGERYVYQLNGDCDGKKGECVDFMDELWNALARIKGRDDMVIGEEP
jgi:hypothetical protein